MNPSHEHGSAGRSATPRRGPFFIVGVPRSGTTLLQYMLRAHPALSLPTGESHFLVPMYLQQDINAENRKRWRGMLASRKVRVFVASASTALPGHGCMLAHRPASGVARRPPEPHYHALAPRQPRARTGWT